MANSEFTPEKWQRLRESKAIDLVDQSGFGWDSVREVFAFNRPLFAVDLICIGFRVDDDGSYF